MEEVHTHKPLLRRYEGSIKALSIKALLRHLRKMEEEVHIHTSPNYGSIKALLKLLRLHEGLEKAAMAHCGLP
jgi:hypothetical protein